MNITEARDIVWAKKPGLKALYETYGDKTWLEYARDKFPTQSLLVHEDEFLNSFRKVLSPLLDSSVVTKACEDIKLRGFVSTADHHGILHHPFFAHASLVRSHNDVKSDTTICLSCGCVSPSNSSYPRGITFEDNDHNREKISFTSLRNRRRPLYGLSGFDSHTFHTQRDRIHLMNLNDDKKAKLLKLFEHIESNERVWNQQYISEQFTVINDILWHELWGDTRGSLVYLEVESLVRQLLLDAHIDNDTLIHQIIFDPATRAQYIEAFNGVTGAHTQEIKKGSVIFWYIDETENTRKALWLQDNALVTEDRSISISLDKDTLHAHLENRTLMPTMAFCYSIISFYYGLTLGGGFSQIDYLGDMKRSWSKVIESKGDEPIDTTTNIFTGEFVLMRDERGHDMTLIDLLLSNPMDIDHAISETQIKATLDRMMPEFVEIVTGTRPEISGIL